MLNSSYVTILNGLWRPIWIFAKKNIFRSLETLGRLTGHKG